MVYTQQRIRPGKWDTKTSLVFWDTNGSPNLPNLYRIVDFAVPVDHRVKLKESEKRDKYVDFARELKKTMEHENDGDTNCNWCSWYSHQRIYTGTGGLKNKRKGEYHSKYSIVKIGQNTEKSPEDKETCCHSNYMKKLSANTGVKKSLKAVK